MLCALAGGKVVVALEVSLMALPAVTLCSVLAQKEQLSIAS